LGLMARQQPKRWSNAEKRAVQEKGDNEPYDSSDYKSAMRKAAYNQKNGWTDDGEARATKGTPLRNNRRRGGKSNPKSDDDDSNSQSNSTDNPSSNSPEPSQGSDNPSDGGGGNAGDGDGGGDPGGILGMVFPTCGPGGLLNAFGTPQANPCNNWGGMGPPNKNGTWSA
jgi:hypothetical protein